MATYSAALCVDGAPIDSPTCSTCSSACESTRRARTRRWQDLRAADPAVGGPHCPAPCSPGAESPAEARRAALSTTMYTDRFQTKKMPETYTPRKTDFLKGCPEARLAGANFAAHAVEPSTMLSRSPRASMLHARPRLRD